MVSKQSKSELRVKKHERLRNRLSGTAERPRLAVFRSNNHMYAQIIDDTVGNTLVSASTAEKAVKAAMEKFGSKFDLRSIIEEKINAMDVNELESLVLTVMKKELDVIVNLGAVIGLVLGMINLLI